MSKTKQHTRKSSALASLSGHQAQQLPANHDLHVGENSHATAPGYGGGGGKKSTHKSKTPNKTTRASRLSNSNQNFKQTTSKMLSRDGLADLNNERPRQLHTNKTSQRTLQDSTNALLNASLNNPTASMPVMPVANKDIH